MKLRNEPFVYILLLLFFSCTHSREKQCELPPMEVLSIETITTSGNVSYQHSVLLDGYSRYCLDSVNIMNLIKLYSDTIRNPFSSLGTRCHPIRSLSIYNSDQDWDRYYGLRSHNDINNNLLLRINFFKNVGTTFYFYNETGESIHEGINWIKNDPVDE